jgi:hypothetical protein
MSLLQNGDYVYVSWHNIPDWEGYGRVTYSDPQSCIEVKCQSGKLGGFPAGVLRKLSRSEVLEAKLLGFY